MGKKYRVKRQGRNIYMQKSTHDRLVDKGVFHKGKPTTADLRGKVRAKAAGSTVYMDKQTHKRWKEEGR